MASKALSQLDSLVTSPRVRGVVKAMLIAVCVLTITGFLGGLHWVLDLGSHFRLQYVVVQLLFACLFIVMKRRGWLVTMAVFALINLSQIVPFYLPDKARYTGEGELGGVIHVLHMNVFRFNQNREAVLQKIQETRADFVSLAEFDAQWIDATQDAPALQTYRHRLTDPKSRIALFTNYPVTNLALIPLKNPDDAIVTATFELDGKRAALVLMHPKPPLTHEFRQRQIDHLHALSTLQHSLPENLIFVGDFNTTSWSHFYTTLTQSTGLQDTRRGFGLQPSWPTQSPLMVIPIDHCLVSANFVTVSRTVGPSIGSDHLPLSVILGLNQEADTPH